MKKRNDSQRLAYNLGEAAKVLGVSRPTMSRLLDTIPHRRFGRRVIIPRSALEEWLAEKEAE